MPYNVPQNIDHDKIFLVNFSELEGRWDPTIFQNQFRFVSKQYTNRKLSSVALIDPKVSFSKLKDDDDISFIPMNIVNEDDGTIKESLYKKVLETKGFTRFQNGDLIWAKITPCMQNGKSAVVRNLRNGYGCGSTEFFVIRPKNDYLLIDYIYIILRDNRFLQTATKYFGGSAGQQRVPKNFLENLIIPIPPLHIQQQIVDVYNAALSQRKKKLSVSKAKLASIDKYLLDELGITLPQKDNSLEKRIFTVNFSKVGGRRLDPFYNNLIYSQIEDNTNKGKFKCVKLKKLCTYTSGVVYSSKDVANEGHAILRANNINLETNDLNLSDIRYIDSNIVLPDSLRLKKDDIFICAASGSKEHAGKVAFIDTDTSFYFGGFMGVLRINNEEIMSYYLFEYLASIMFKETLYRNLGGTNINNINFEMIKNIKIPLPPLEKQREIANNIAAIRAEAKRLEQEGEEILQSARLQVEQMILGEKDIEG